jgi:hypothetical protein
VGSCSRSSLRTGSHKSRSCSWNTHRIARSAPVACYLSSETKRTDKSCHRASSGAPVYSQDWHSGRPSHSLFLVLLGKLTTLCYCRIRADRHARLATELGWIDPCHTRSFFAPGFRLLSAAIAAAGWFHWMTSSVGPNLGDERRQCPAEFD